MEPNDGYFRHRGFFILFPLLFVCSSINPDFQYKSKHYHVMTSKIVNLDKD